MHAKYNYRKKNNKNNIKNGIYNMEKNLVIKKEQLPIDYIIFLRHI